MIQRNTRLELTWIGTGQAFEYAPTSTQLPAAAPAPVFTNAQEQTVAQLAYAQYGAP